MHVGGLPRAFDVPDDLDQQVNPLAWTRLQVSVVASILSAERMSVSLIAGSAFSDDAWGAKEGEGILPRASGLRAWLLGVDPGEGS